MQESFCAPGQTVMWENNKGSVMNKKKSLPSRPSDDLPVEELQRQWNKYLDAHVGRPDAHPRWEVLMDIRKLEIMVQYLNIPADYMKMEPSPRIQLYIQAFENVVDKLPLIQKTIIKRYAGIGWPEPQTQAQIAKETISDRGNKVSQQMVAKYIRWAKRNLKVLIRKEAAKLAKEALRGELPDGL